MIRLNGEYLPSFGCQVIENVRKETVVEEEDETKQSWFALIQKVFLEIIFLSDPGKPGVRSLGPDVCH